MAEIATPATAPPPGPGPIRRLSQALRHPFRRASASSASAGEPDHAAPNSDEASPSRALDELPPIQSQEQLADSGSAHDAQHQGEHPKQPNFLRRVLSSPSAPAPPAEAADALPSSPHHSRHPADAHARGQRYIFTSPDVDQATPFDVLAVNDVDVEGIVRGPDQPVRRKSTLQPDPLYKVNSAASAGASGAGSAGEHARTPIHHNQGMMVLDTGDYIQDHVLKAAAKVRHPFSKSSQAPWCADPAELEKDHEEQARCHAAQALALERQEEQAKAARLEQQRQEKAREKATHPERTQSVPANLLQRLRSPSRSEHAPNEPEPRTETGTAVEPQTQAQEQGSKPVPILQSKTASHAHPQPNTNTQTQTHAQESAARSPTEPASPGTSPVQRLTRALSLKSTPSSPPQPGAPVRHPGLVHILDTGDVVQDKVLGAFAYMGRRRSSASAGTKSPIASPTSKAAVPTSHVPPLAETLEAEDTTRSK